MNRPDVMAFVFLAGMGFGLLLAMAALWFVSRAAGEPLRRQRELPPETVMAGVEVRDSSMGEFEAVRRAV